MSCHKNSPQKRWELSQPSRHFYLVYVSIIYHGNIETEQNIKDKVINENNNRCTVNDFIFVCSLRFIIIIIIIIIITIIVKNHLLETVDVINCTGYTIFANTLNL